jgi:hypothetical protein
MEEGAYEVLERQGLPHPCVHKLRDLQHTAGGRLFFVRLRSGIGRSRVYTCDSIRAGFDDLLGSEERGEIIQIEDAVHSIGGGCLVVDEGVAYMELVDGHLSALTLSAALQQRVLKRGEDIRRRLHVQREIVEQSGNASISASETRHDPEQTIAGVFAMTGHINERLLLEFVIDRSHRIWFTDAKKYPWPIVFENALVENGVVWNDGAAGGLLYSGPFTLPNLKAVTRNSTLVLGDAALLSHFVTYSLRQGIARICM